MTKYVCLNASLTRCLFLFVFLAASLSGVLAAQSQNAADGKLWITTGQDFFDALGRTPGVLSTALPPQAAAAQGGVVVTQVQERDIPALSRFGHEKFNRCSGFVVHKSRQEAIEAMQTATAVATKTLPSDFTISHQSTVNGMLPSLDKANILSTIDYLSNTYTNRYYTYTSGQNAALWIRDQWLALKGSRSDITVTTYNHSFTQDSVVMTIQGNSLASEIVVLGGHLDSIKSGGMTTGTVAPGADDNASGIATITEVIRVLMDNNFTPDRTIKFIGYAAEEVGLLGSADIAADAQTAGDDVVAVMQLDMTDYNGSAEDIVLMDDFTNADLSAFIGTLVTEYQPSALWTYSTCGYGCSDHASWHNRGYPAVMPFEARMGQHNSAIHSSNDTLATLGNQADHALKFAKLGLSYIVETGLADCTPAAVANAGPDKNIEEGNSVQIGTAAQPSTTYSWTPGGATTAQINVSPASTTVYTVTATTSCGSAQDAVTVTVTPAGQNGPQTATYNAGLGAPSCAVAGSSCDSLGLLDGRGTVGPEPNQPNTLGACTDGTSGAYHSDESSDKIVVSTLDGLDFTEGATVQVDVTVYAYSTGGSDTLDLWYAADANSPAWQLIGSYTSGGGVQTISAQYTLPSGGLQAVRANYRYQGSQSTCSTGNYDDTDDLVFAVKTGGGGGCTVDAECSDGAFCNGAEVCNAGTCEAGTAPNCNDGVSCTADSCNEGTDSCDNTPNNAACDDGLYCNGSEICNVISDCQAGTPVSCTFGCNEVGDVCYECSVDADCDDGLFCNGSETCNAGSCQAGSDPCPGQSCDEGGDVCSASNGPQDAVYDGTLGAPKCAVAGSECDTLTLINGRGTVGPEPNQPNTVDTCTDGSSGTYHSDESIDKIVVKTLDSSDFAEGATVQVDVTVWAYSTTADTLDVYYAADANNPSWVHVSSPKPPGTGAQTISVQYTLPAGSLQAVRANFRYNGSQSSCSAGSYDDKDDVVFAVNAGTPPPPSTCTVDDDFESGTPNWSNAAASTCTSGAYVEGNPTNPGGGYQVVGSHSGTASIYTGNNTSAGADDVDGGNCILDSPSWSVTNASTLSVWYWFGQRDAGDDAAGDFQRVEYSTNGGSSWTTLVSNGDSTINPVWAEATASIPAGSSVKLRVQCSDGTAGGDLVECGIDDVSICE